MSNLFGQGFKRCSDDVLWFLETFVTVRGIIRPVLITSLLTWFIIYIYIFNLHFLNNVHIIKNNVNTPTDMGYIVCLCRLGPFCFLANTNFYINWTSKILTMNT